MNTITMHIGDVRDVMADLPDNHADQLDTSPPFWQLRSYLPGDHEHKHREIGSESRLPDYMDTLYELTAEWRRLIPEWGSVCVELGDTMSGSGGGGGDYLPGGFREGQPGFGGSAAAQREGNAAHWRQKQAHRADLPETKSMCLIPHLYTIGLAYGHNPLTGTPSPAGRWRIRNVVAWARPNPPVGSLGKRNVERRTGDQKFRPATSYITIACTGTGRYFDLDAVRVDMKPHSIKYASTGHNVAGLKVETSPSNQHRMPGYEPHGAGAPPLDWHTDDLDGDWLWKLATAPYSGSHYAVYPLTLPRRLILAMCPSRVCQVCGWPSERIAADGEAYRAYREATGDFTSETRMLGVNAAQFAHLVPPRERTTLGWTDCGCSTDGSHWRPGRVLDPFGGSGTTAVAAALEGRDAVLIDIDARNIDLVHRRLTETVRIHDRTDTKDAVTWTVETVSERELEAIHNGQTSLFDPPAA